MDKHRHDRTSGHLYEIFTHGLWPLYCKRALHKERGREPRKLSSRPREEHELLIASREKQRTPEWKQLYNRPAGIEATFSQGVRSLALRRSRYRGLPKCHLQNVAIACAINLQRLSDYWSGVHPTSTRTSAFVQLGRLGHVRIRQQCP